MISLQSAFKLLRVFMRLVQINSHCILLGLNKNNAMLCNVCNTKY